MEKLLTVSQLNNYIKGVFNDELILQDITVTGEIFEFKTVSNNSYITLKEHDCSLNCVYFASAVEYKAGQKVSATGRVEFYPKSGKVFFKIIYLNLLGRGELLAALHETKSRLQKEGVFDNRRPLPALVKNVALISSCGGAVVYDFLEVVKPLNYLTITIFDVRVQGEDAKKQILSTMSGINNGFLGEFDVILLARGGGSANDLNEFNNEELAKAVNKSKTPVISAIGHETDYTLCDFAADIRAGTPSIAASLLSENNRLFFEKLFSAASSCLKNVKDIFKRKLIKLNGLAQRGHAKLYGKNRKAYNSIVLSALSIHARTEKTFLKKHNLCAGNLTRQSESLSDKITAAENLINIHNARLHELNPAKILSKGYAKIYKNDKAVVFSKDLLSGDDIKILMADGKTSAIIKENSVLHDDICTTATNTTKSMKKRKSEK